MVGDVQTVLARQRRPPLPPQKHALLGLGVAPAALRPVPHPLGEAGRVGPFKRARQRLDDLEVRRCPDVVEQGARAVGRGERAPQRHFRLVDILQGQKARSVDTPTRGPPAGPLLARGEALQAGVTHEPVHVGFSRAVEISADDARLERASPFGRFCRGGAIPAAPGGSPSLALNLAEIR
eukprot:CAMPEP_0179947214 /NCGR_PEP_ID=MMETSP0983-20121128/20875_1 /TAXON_ID=483367 /ORGANISM="non described non described, Strain CCMP 2436" /LENGTH=179 /DNA_ID=CAMNT_0021856257 /DNA_START=277 /DNA_END=816 /DNA_ORIENTATION=+